MRKSKLFPLLASGLLLLGACVTINVYFPAAEAQQAAAEFVDKVIGNDPAESAPAPASPPSAMLRRPFNPLSLLISDAQAQESVDITIHTPAIQAIQNRMTARFHADLESQFDAGSLGFGNDGLIVVRDASKVALKDRVGLNESVAEDNRDRKAVYREVAVANGHPEWETEIRQTFARQWVASAHKGWWYQDSKGGWKQK